MTYFISCTTQITIFNYYIEDINPIYQFDTLVTSKIVSTQHTQLTCEYQLIRAIGLSLYAHVYKYIILVM